MARIALVFAVAALMSGAAMAAPSGFGLGIIVGEPTGLSAKAWMGGNAAVDAAAAWSFYRHSALHIHADFLLHNFGLLPVSAGELPLYYGIGGRIKFIEHDEDDDKIQLGVRVPVGLEYLFQDAPFGLFVEVVPLLDLVPDTDFDFNGGIGCRFYFR